jgi:hypothetical protein
MDVFIVDSQPLRVVGQVMLSLPGLACMQCLLEVIQQQDIERNTPATTEPITTETEKDNGQEADQHVADDASD